MKNSLPTRTKRTVELATEKGSSNWLTVITLKELDYSLNKKEFIQVTVRVGNNRHAYDRSGDQFSVDHAMVFRRGRFIIQRHNGLRDLEAEMLRMVCKGVEVGRSFRRSQGRH